MLSQFYAPVVGGEERLLECLSRELVQRGHDVAVATLALDAAPPARSGDAEIRVHRLASLARRLPWVFSDPGRPHLPPAPDPILAREIVRVIELEQPDVLHAHNWIAHSCVAARAATAKPLVLSLHDYSLVCATKRLMAHGEVCDGPAPLKCVRCSASHYGPAKGVSIALLHLATHRRLLRSVDAFVPVSHTVAASSGLALTRHEVVPNFIAANGEPEPAASNLRWLDELLPSGPFALYVGDLVYDKGVGVAVEAFERDPSLPPLVLIGRTFESLRVSPSQRVRPLGELPAEAVQAAWRRSSFGIVPSLWQEPFGLAAIEAMSAGTPVVGSRAGALQDIVLDGVTGFLVPPADTGALAHACRRLTLDDRLRERLGQAALEHSRQFGPEHAIPRFEAVYDELAGARIRELVGMAL
jgi:glycosyltransferase involved in cell wall biosynthesis